MELRCACKLGTSLRQGQEHPFGPTLGNLPGIGSQVCSRDWNLSCWYASQQRIQVESWALPLFLFCFWNCLSGEPQPKKCSWALGSAGGLHQQGGCRFLCESPHQGWWGAKGRAGLGASSVMLLRLKRNEGTWATGALGRQVGRCIG